MNEMNGRPIIPNGEITWVHRISLEFQHLDKAKDVIEAFVKNNYKVSIERRVVDYQERFILTVENLLAGETE